jgi:hypothetical protein
LKAAGLPAIFGPNLLEIRFHPDYNHLHEACSAEPSLARIREAVRTACGRPVEIRVRLVDVPRSEKANSTPLVNPAADKKRALMELPLFRRAAESLGAQIWHLDDAFNPEAAPVSEAAAVEDSQVEPEEA